MDENQSKKIGWQDVKGKLGLYSLMRLADGDVLHISEAKPELIELGLMKAEGEITDDGRRVAHEYRRSVK